MIYLFFLSEKYWQLVIINTIMILSNVAGIFVGDTVLTPSIEFFAIGR